MKKLIFSGLILLVILSCDKNNHKTSTPKVKSESNPATVKNSLSQSQENDKFEDFKKKEDESCEDDIEKKLIPEKPKAFNLQGGDVGCDIE